MRGNGSISDEIFTKSFDLFRASPPRQRASRSLSSFSHVDSQRKSIEVTTPPREIKSEYLKAKMAFSFANTTGAVGGVNMQAQAGPELQEIQTEQLGFHALAGESKIRLLPTPWPSNALPPPTSSLLSIASRRGLIAAAGPEGLIIASTEAVRQAFKADVTVENNIKPFTPQLVLPNVRISHVVFSSDESSLVIAAEEGGGLAVYDINALMQGGKESAFQMSTNGNVRSLVRNPIPGKSHIFAVLSGTGNLMLADLQSRSLVSGNNGPVLAQGVSCVTWAPKGTHLIAGLGNATALQLDQIGEVKGMIPRPPQIQGDQHVSTVCWLKSSIKAANEFLLIYTPSTSPPGEIPQSTFLYAHREGNFCGFRALPDPCGIFGMPRSPPGHFINRLGEFPPNIDDLLVVSSTSDGNIGMITKSSSALSADVPGSEITQVYTTTAMAIDSRRAALPITDEGMDSSAIGMDLDLSAKERVLRPIPSDEMDESPTPVPALMVLNHEGILSSWWIIHNASIRQGKRYPGLVVQGSGESTISSQSNSADASIPVPATPANSFAGPVSQHATPSFGAPSLAGSQSGNIPKPTTPAFGSPTRPGSFSAFGSASALGGGNRFSWGGSPANNTAPQTGGATFGKPSFGSASPLGGGLKFGQSTPLAASSGNTTFGGTSMIGSKPSIWGAPTAQQMPPTASKATSVFGGGTTTSSFASVGANSSSGLGSPFASFSNGSGTSGFASLGSQTKPGQPAFATTPSGSSFGTLSKETSFGSTTGGSTLASSNSLFNSTPTPSFGNAPAQQSTSVFGKPIQNLPQAQESDMNDIEEKPEREASATPKEKPATLFGAPPSGFKLGSTFKGDGTAKDDLPKPSTTGKSMFGNSFGNALGEVASTTPTASPIKKEQEITDEPRFQDISTTPKTPVGGPGVAPVNGGFVDVRKPEPFLPTVHREETPNPMPAHIDRAETPPLEPEPAPLPPSPKVSKPSATDDEAPPLAGSPPISVQAPSSPLSSSRSDAAQGPPDDAPLPPDFISTPGKVQTEDSPLSPDFASTITPAKPRATDASQKPSFGLQHQQHPSWSFDTVSSVPHRPMRTPKARSTSRSPIRLAQPPQQAISHTPAGFPKGGQFPPPQPAIPESPRSPSPVRSTSTPIPGRPISVPPAKPVSRPTSKSVVPPTPPPIEEEPSFEADDTAKRNREELQEPVIGTKKLDSFLSYQDYVNPIPKSTKVTLQIERVYRDIQSMIDTLGLNARTLDAFVLGHTEETRNIERTKDDLEYEDGWALEEVEALGNILKEELGTELEVGRVKNVKEKLDALRKLFKAVRNLRQRFSADRNVISAHTDEHRLALIKAAPLSADQSAQQADLRQKYADHMKLLAQVEEDISVLKVKFAAGQCGTNNGGRGQQQPTVEAVTNTILKMTRMVEEKSGDIDVLETQMRKLRMASTTPGPNSLSGSLMRSSLLGSRASREASPFATPPLSRRGFGHSQGYGLVYTPDASPAQSRLLGSSMVASSLLCKAVFRPSEEEVKKFREAKARRKRFGESLKAVVLERGARDVEMK
ncbi:hypothetical protein M501DRAFT_1019380 [Patellaria atrata CBS 101060]|uniref:Nucleoporin Nup159/Nup146 N-terminal domain-containing protein n=1 Tax=Patellaria atrata CBS 101060 TaxID=1346257 RepID=A0A9P4VPR3_9PEZI|nr:hypothetical protein M501DRAFT_1019380 [Patellaria atrata CBS 101060]